MSESEQGVTGSCLCGAVAFKVEGPLRDVVACHCGQCQRTHGHYAAYSRAGTEDVIFSEQRGLKWFKSSDLAERGFCSECGSSLFWRPLNGSHVAVAAGSLDNAPDLKLVGHIYCDDIPDYYSLSDDLPKYPGTADGVFDGGLKK